ncbi:DinB family protein [Paenibacillus septentrionalis]|uniref:DinB family protein n=1 Tax=Paenibacillus septentrionalis TaxID=429342 RepID=A0ABW1V4F7_9BACL
MEIQEINHNLKETRDKLLAILKRVDQIQLYMKKDVDTWSIGQICQHLIKTEELFVLAIRKGLSKEDSFIEKKSLEFLLDRSEKIAAPDIAKPTDEVIEYNEIIEKLKKSRAKLNEILSSIEDPTILNKKQYIHPVFKEMLLIDWVKTLYLHEQRHIKQINEIIKGLK